MSPRRVLVTGATGRVAAPLIPALQERHDVRLLDRASGDGDGTDARMIVGALTDRGAAEPALEGLDAVVHLAGNPDPAAPLPELEDPNIEAFVALLGAAR